MSTYKVVVTEDLFGAYDEEKAVLSKVDADLSVFDCESQEELIEVVKDADGVLMHTNRQVDSDVIRHMTCRRVISRYGIGYDNIDVEAATRAGIWVSRVTEYGAEEDVTDQALG